MNKVKYVLSKKVWDGIFNILCFLTGQYVTSEEIFNKTKTSSRVLLILLVVFSIILSFCSLFINLSSTAFNIYIIWKCPFKYCGYIDVYVNNTGYEAEQLSLKPDAINVFDDFQKFLFTSASVSGTLSFCLMIYVIYTQYRFPLKFDSRNKLWHYFDDNIPLQNSEGNETVKLNPFVWYNPENDHTLLLCDQLISFYFVFFLNISIFIASVVIFYILFSWRYNYSDTFQRKFIDIGGLTSQFYSWYCSILSCFIFSKVAYAVRNVSVYRLFPCLDEVANLDLNPDHVNLDQGGAPIEPADVDDFKKERLANSVADIVDSKMKCFSSNRAKTQFRDNVKNKEYLIILSKIDKLYQYTLKDSLQPYGKWFAVHWLMYTLTAFLSVAYVIQAVLMELYGHKEKCHGEHNEYCRLSLAYIMLFSLNHCLLFLYPCFRAATVTSTRQVLIRKVSEADWPLVPLEQKQAFIQSLKDGNCTFKVSVMCAQVDFGFNITFFSIFVGIMGVVLKLSL